MYYVSYLVPPGHPLVKAELDKTVMEMTASLKGVDKKMVNVPNTGLCVRLKLMPDGGSIEIKKRKELVYINLFCMEAQHMDSVFGAVCNLYVNYKLGTPKRPSMPTWIHSIPVAEHLLRENELQLCHKMTVSYYWAVFAQLLKKRNPLN
jgi:hypothetical protein